MSEKPTLIVKAPYTSKLKAKRWREIYYANTNLKMVIILTFEMKKSCMAYSFITEYMKNLGNWTKVKVLVYINCLQTKVF